MAGEGNEAPEKVLRFEDGEGGGQVISSNLAGHLDRSSLVAYENMNACKRRFLGADRKCEFAEAT